MYARTIVENEKDKGYEQSRIMRVLCTWHLSSTKSGMGDLIYEGKLRQLKESGGAVFTDSH